MAVLETKIQKRFILSDKGLILENQLNVDKFVESKVEYFSIHSNYLNKEDMLDFFKEISDMCAYDVADATFNFDYYKNHIGFDSEKN